MFFICREKGKIEKWKIQKLINIIKVFNSSVWEIVFDSLKLQKVSEEFKWLKYHLTIRINYFHCFPHSFCLIILIWLISIIKRNWDLLNCYSDNKIRNDLLSFIHLEIKSKGSLNISSQFFGLFNWSIMNKRWFNQYVISFFLL